MWFLTQAYMETHTTHGASGSEPALTAWTDEELAALAGANELTVAPLRNDGTVQGPRIVWVVRRGMTSTSDP